MKRYRLQIISVLLMALLFFACDSGGGSDEDQTLVLAEADLKDGTTTIDIRLSMNPNIFVLNLGTPIQGASVKVNNNIIPEEAMFPGNYTLDVNTINAGDLVTLTVDFENDGVVDLTKSVSMPYPVSITSPANNANISFSSQQTVTWNNPSSIFHNTLSLDYSGNFDPAIDLNINSTSYNIPGGALSSSGFAKIFLTTENESLISGSRYYFISSLECTNEVYVNVNNSDAP